MREHGPGYQETSVYQEECSVTKGTTASPGCGSAFAYQRFDVISPDAVRLLEAHGLKVSRRCAGDCGQWLTAAKSVARGMGSSCWHRAHGLVEVRA